MIIDFNLLFTSFSAAGILVASIFTIKNYYLIKTLENENHLYKYKMESYHALNISLYQLTDELQEYWSIFRELKDEERILNRESYEKKLSDSGNNFRKNIIKHSLFVSQSILDILEDFYDFYIEDVAVSENTDNSVDEFIEKCLAKNEVIANAMRKDLNVDLLNLKIGKRILK